MTRTVELALPSGRIVYAEVAETDAEWQDLALSDRLPGDLAETFDRLRETLDVAAGKLAAIGPRPPDKLVLELSVEIATGGAFKLLAGDVKGGVKVSLTWDRPGGGGAAKAG